MIRRFTRIVKGMVVYPDRMRENLDRSRGVIFSGTAAGLELAAAALRANTATVVQRNAMRSFEDQPDSATC